jgi:hypothetical protein
MWNGVGDGMSSPNRFVMRDSIIDCTLWENYEAGQSP